MHEGTATIDIDAAAEDIFAVLADLESYPEWIPETRDVEIEDVDEDGYATASTMTMDVTVREVTYTLDYEWDEPDKVSWESRDGGDVKHISGHYELSMNDDGTTHVEYMLSIDPGFPVPGFMLKRATKLIVSRGLKGLKKRVEDG